jgi:hypothetical protein
MKHGHDAVWKRKCVEIGARPEHHGQPRRGGGWRVAPHAVTDEAVNCFRVRPIGSGQNVHLSADTGTIMIPVTVRASGWHWRFGRSRVASTLGPGSLCHGGHLSQVCDARNPHLFTYRNESLAQQGRQPALEPTSKTYPFKSNCSFGPGKIFCPLRPEELIKTVGLMPLVGHRIT